MYEARDLARLEQIVALKYLGFSLRQIRAVLARDLVDLLEALRIQHRLLEEKRTRINRAIRVVSEVESQIRAAGTAKLAALRNIIEVIEMEANEDWTAESATEEGRVKMNDRKHLWTPELQERVSREWTELIADVESSLDEDPASDKARALAARWNGLVEEFTGRDKDLEQSVANVWANQGSWPTQAEQAPQIKPEVWRFIALANQSLGT